MWLTLLPAQLSTAQLFPTLVLGVFPLFVVFLVLQRQVVAGISVGAGKGLHRVLLPLAPREMGNIPGVVAFTRPWSRCAGGFPAFGGKWALVSGGALFVCEFWAGRQLCVSHAGTGLGVRRG